MLIPPLYGKEDTIASGDTVLQILQSMPCAASQAGLVYHQGGSTPGELYPTWSFDDSADEYIDYLVRLGDNYAGGGLTITLVTEAVAASGVVRWAVAFRRVNDDAEDMDASHSYSFQAVNQTVPSAIGNWGYPNVTFSDAQIDGLQASELAIMRIYRDQSDAADTLVGDAYLVAVFGRES